MMNAMAFYRHTGDPDWLNQARAVADNVINIMKSPERIAHEVSMHGKKWADPELGVPYIYNPGGNGKREFSSWGLAKIAIGLVEIAVYSGTDDYDRKIEQISEFLVTECMIDFGGLILHRPNMTSDRVPAQYYNGYVGGKTLYVSNTTTGDWLIWPIAYSAAILNNKTCGEVFPRLVNQMGELLDWGPPVTHEKYEIGIGSLNGNVVTITGIDLTGLTKLHNLRLEDASGNAALYHIVEINGNQLQLQEFWKTPGSTFGSDQFTATVVGPLGEDQPNPDFFVRSTLDRAVRSISVSTFNRPDPSRPFDWANGRHFNNWQKMVAVPLTQAGLVYQGLKIFLENQEKGHLLGIGGADVLPTKRSFFPKK